MCRSCSMFFCWFTHILNEKNAFWKYRFRRSMPLYYGDTSKSTGVNLADFLHLYPLRLVCTKKKVHINHKIGENQGWTLISHENIADYCGVVAVAAAAAANCTWRFLICRLKAQGSIILLNSQCELNGLNDTSVKQYSQTHFSVPFKKTGY